LSPEGIDFLLSQYFVLDELQYHHDEEVLVPAPVTALRGHAQDRSLWESLIRILLRIRVNLHGPVPRKGQDFSVCFHCNPAGYGTALDELFRYERTEPFDADEDAADWLQVLESEGRNVRTYFGIEQDLHAGQMHLTMGSGWYHKSQYSRRLIFDFENGLSVTCDWWIDPSSSIAEVLEKFRYLVIFWLYFIVIHQNLATRPGLSLFLDGWTIQRSMRSRSFFTDVPATLPVDA